RLAESNLSGEEVFADPRVAAPPDDILPVAPGQRDELQLPRDAPDQKRRVRRQPCDDVRRLTRRARDQRVKQDGGDPQHGKGDQQLLNEEAEYARQKDILKGDILAAHVELSTDAFFVDHEADMTRRLMSGTSIPSHHSADDTAWDQAQFNIGSDVEININDMFQIVGATGDAMDELASRY
ncbi:hypothetical protein HN873_068473, partial [Arachis hypogaea]